MGWILLAAVVIGFLAWGIVRVGNRRPPSLSPRQLEAFLRRIERGA